MKYKTAVIGCGWIGLRSQTDKKRAKPASHAEAYAMHPKTDLVGFADVSKESLDSAEKLYPKVPRFEDVRKMLKAVKPDIVSIATMADSHCAYIKLCAEHSVKVIICEKPISDELYGTGGAREAVDVCRKGGSILLVNHMRRFNPLIRKFRDSYKDYIGAIKAASVYYGQGLFHTGTHLVDLLRFFMGEAVWVSAIRNDNFTGGREFEGDYNIDGLVGFKSGAVAVLQSFEMWDYALSEVSFFGNKGRMNLKKMAGLEIEIVHTRPCEGYSDYRELAYDSSNILSEGKSMTWEPMVSHAIDCLEDRDKPVSTGEDAISAIEILIALRKSAEHQGEKQCLS